MTTKNKYHILKGKLEIRAKFTPQEGVWPAWWLLGANIDEVDWPLCGEVDILEYYKNQLHFNVTFIDQYEGQPWFSEHLDFDSDEFHTYGLEWNNEEIRFYLDNKEVFAFYTSLAEIDGKNIFKENEFYMILNLAIGGINGGDISKTVFPARYEIDYVRVYELD